MMLDKMPKPEYNRKSKAIAITSSCKTTPVLSLELAASERDIKELTIERIDTIEISRNVTVDRNDAVAGAGR